MNDLREAHACHAAAWKSHSASLPEAAKEAAPYINQAGEPRGRYPYCLPVPYADYNLLPQVRDGVIGLFNELQIPWHAGIDGGPSNHLLSSQVQCANALYGMVNDPLKVQLAFGKHVAIDQVLEIEPGRFMTFEYIGPVDFFNEGRGEPRIRGAHCTSVDAAFRYRAPDGRIELALVEWKFTESYATQVPSNPQTTKTREARYRTAFEAANGSIRTDLVDLEVLFDEPFYQLVRQQLLAQELERVGAEGADTVRVLHVLDPANDAYQASLVTTELRALGSTVDEVWSLLLASPDRFHHIDPAVFHDPDVTSSDYAARYALPGALQP